MFRNFADIIGMTGVGEAIVAREREICLAILATVTDYDSFSERPVSMEDISKTMKENEEKVKQIIATVIKNVPQERNCICKEALKNAKA
jgi:5'-methylthioadenosine phosphorylase